MSEGRTVYLNGRFVAERDAHISMFDAGLVWGAMLFETTRSFGQIPFKLRDHLERLRASMAVTGIDGEMTVDQLDAATHELIRRNVPHFAADDDFSIVHNVSPGPSMAYADAAPDAGRPTVAIYIRSMAASLGEMATLYETGVRAYVPRQRSLPGRLLDPKVKSRSRLHYWMATNEAEREDPGAWAVLSDDDGYLTEGSGSNFFVVREGVVMTPEPRHILRGVTRQTVLDLAGEIGVPVREANLEPFDVIDAQEAFFASTPYVMMPATTFNGRRVGDGRPGPITMRLLDAFGETVGVDIVGQAKAYAERV